MEGTPAAAAAGTAGPEQQQQERLEALAADLERLYQQQQAYAAPRVAEASNSSERGVSHAIQHVGLCFCAASVTKAGTSMLTCTGGRFMMAAGGLWKL